MCFDLKTSLRTFVLGTILNMLAAFIVMTRPYTNKPLRLAGLGLWQFALLMQLPEAVQWWHLTKPVAVDNTTTTTKPASGAAAAAFWLNTLQPAMAALLVGLTAYFTGQRSVACIMLACVPALLFTAISAMSSKSLLKRKPDIRPSEGCPHLNLHWWEKGTAVQRALPLYLAGVFLPILLLPSRMRTVQGIVFFGSLLLTMFLYDCGVASLWCWSVAVAGASVLIP